MIKSKRIIGLSQEINQITMSALSNVSERGWTRGKGLGDGLEHRIQYVARLTNNGVGINGNSWLVTSLPYLVFSAATSGGLPQSVIRVTKQKMTTRFGLSGSAYGGKFGTRQKLTVEGGDYVVTMIDGSKNVFYGPGAVAGLRGKLKKSVGVDGVETLASYDGNQRIVSLKRNLGSTGQSAGLYYTFAASGVHVGRITQVEKRLSRAGVEQPVKRWVYTYHTGTDDEGSLNDLKTAGVEVFNAQTGAWERTATSYYRYYTAAGATGFKHGLKYAVGPQAYAQMAAAGLAPDVAVVPDAAVAQCATDFREWDSQKRMTKQVRWGGALTKTYARLASAGGAVNWRRRTVVTQPDGSTVTRYFNSLNQVVLSVLQQGAESWPTYCEYDADNHKTLEAGPDAIASFTLPTSPSTSLTVTLQSSRGLLKGWQFYPLSGGGAGSAPGFLQKTWVKKGSGGTEVKLEEKTYTSFAAGAQTVYREATVKRYRSEASGGSDPATTSYGWQWQSSQLLPVQKTTTLPVVATTENGTGVAATTVERYDSQGNATWVKDEAGVLGYAVWDGLTGAPVRQVADVDTQRMDPTIVPSGWVTPAGGGLHLITDFQSDAQGRWTLELGPEHPLEVGGVVRMARQARYRVYLDGRRQQWSADGYAAGDGFRTLGAARVTQWDEGGRVTDELAVSMAEDDRIDGADQMPQSRWTRWTRTIYDQVGTWRRSAT